MELREIATGLRFPEGPIAMPDGSFVLVEIERQTLSRISASGKVEVIATLGGSPNGAAIGPDGACYVCNSGGFSWHRDPQHGLRGGHQPADYSGGRIERVDLSTGESRVLYGPETGLKGPNDIVFDRQGGFWFTDSGKVRENDRDHGAVYYATIDGKSLRRVIYPVIQPQPNGIGLSPDESRLYVAETACARVWAFDITAPGEVEKKPFPSPAGGTFIGSLPHYGLFDSLGMEAGGNICVATMMSKPCITVYAPEGGIVEQVEMPDTLPTNICFGGPDLRTAYITLSGTGRLVAADWPRPGLALNFLNR